MRKTATERLPNFHPVVGNFLPAIHQTVTRRLDAGGVIAIRSRSHSVGFFTLLLAHAALVALGQEPGSTAPHLRGGPRQLVASVPRLPVSGMTQELGALPELPADVAELRFADFFQLPVGPRGLKPSAQLQQLDGRKVRLVGYFVFEDWGTCFCPPESSADTAGRKARRPMPAWMKHVVPGRIMLAARPVSVSLGHYGLCDDLPPQVAYLSIASKFGEPVFFRPGLYAVTGTLSLGNRDEPDGRVSYVRLNVESDEQIVPVGRPPTPAPAPAPAPAVP